MCMQSCVVCLQSRVLFKGQCDWQQWQCTSVSTVISIPETRKSLDPGAKYTMPVCIHKDVSVGEWHKTLWELLLIRVVWVPGQKGQEVGGSCRFSGAVLQFQGKNLPWKQALISASHSQLSDSVSWGTAQRTASLSLCLNFFFNLYPKLEWICFRSHM